MGTSLALSLRGVAQDELSALTRAVHERLEEINAAMSTYRPDSEISRFNGFPVGKSMKLSSDFGRVLEFSLKIAGRTNGAFDPTVAPLVRAWGFGAGAKRGQKHAPGAQALSVLLEDVGYQKLRYDMGSRTLMRSGKLELDLSAVAKGYGVDAVREVLGAHGVEHMMVEIGGEVCVSGRPEPRRPWRIGIESPSSDAASARSVLKMLDLKDACLATSGDYRSYQALDGKRRQHTIDPRTGASVLNGLASVSVLSTTAMQADALATAMMVLGPEASLQLARDESLEIMMITRQGEDLELQYGGGFAQRLSDAR